MEELAGSTGVEEFNTDGTDTTDVDERRERRIAETIDRMLVLRGTDEEANFTLEMLRHSADSDEALRVPGVLAVPAQMHDVFGLRQVVASLDLAAVSLRGQC